MIWFSKSCVLWELTQFLDVQENIASIFVYHYDEIYYLSQVKPQKITALMTFQPLVSVFD